MGKLQKTLGELTAGGKEIQPTGELLHKMGVSVKEIADGNLEAILPKIVESFEENVELRPAGEGRHRAVR